MKKKPSGNQRFHSLMPSYSTFTVGVRPDGNLCSSMSYVTTIIKRFHRPENCKAPTQRRMIFKKLCRGRIATFCPRWHFDIVDEPLSRTRSTLVPLEYSPKTLLSSSFVGQSLERKTLFPGHFLLLPTYNLPFSGLMNHGVLRSMSAYMVWRLQSNSTSLIN